MGIRYSAYPVHPFDVAEALRCARCFLARERGPSEWEQGEDLPRWLDLDKSWSGLHSLFEHSRFKANDAELLVQGDVTHTSDGWIPHYAALDPSAVRNVARGIARFDEARVRSHVARQVWTIRDTEEEVLYLTHHLEAAKSFTRLLADKGYGLVYVIG